MKPLYLEISAWGPYPSVNKVDFSRFSNGELFLISGSTGSGKTTIFDGIIYALYGEVSGKIRSKDSLRSDFAHSEAETYVILTFLHGEKEYRIERHPKYSRPKKRGEGLTIKKEEASLFLEGGNVITGTVHVNQKIKELLSIDYEQFKQLSMLAQGEFMDLLTAKSSQRADVFRSIFHTQIYQNVQRLAGEKARKLKEQIQQLEYRMEEAGAPFAENLDYKQVLEHGDFQKFLGLLLEKKKEVKRGKKQLEKRMSDGHEIIMELEGFCNECQRLQEELVRKDKEIARLTEQKEEVFHVLKKEEEREKILEKRAPEMEKLRKRCIFLEDAKKKAQEGKEIKEKKEKLFVQVEMQKERKLAASYQNWKCQYQQVLDLEKEIQKLNNTIEKQTTEYHQIDRRLVEEKNFLTKIQSEYFAANVGILAAGLKDGEACPVCGSKSHPKKARIQENMPDEKEIEKQQEITARAEKEFQKCYQAIMKSKERMKGKEILLAQKEEELPPEPEVPEKIKQYNFEKMDLREEEQALERILQAYTSICGRWEGLSAEIHAFLSENGKITKEYVQICEKLNCYEKETGENEKQLQEARLSSARIQTLLSERQQQKLNCLKELPPKEQIEEKSQMLQKKYEEKQEDEIEREKVVVLLNKIMQAQQSLTEKLDVRRSIEKEYGIAGDLDRLLNGNNSLRLNFEQYVLASYFEDVLMAANVRFLKMTNGRYEMFRQESVSDGRKKDNLEIDILDYYTGKKRSVKTLSGGESFKAALCLALGLSDVIQSYAGGIQIDVLFVDEGFGALDEESLAQAVDTLMSLAGEKQMIGIISHVTELKDRIEHQIIVKKRKEGSNIT